MLIGQSCSRGVMNCFGSFLEQLGRAIYEGVYDAGSKLSDSQGFRKDVVAEVA